MGPRSPSPSSRGPLWPRPSLSSPSTSWARPAPWRAAVPTRSTGASGPACTPSSATRPSAAAPPRFRRTSSPTGPSPCPASRAADPLRKLPADPRATCIIGVARHTWHPSDAPDGAPEPLAMWEQVSRDAAADTGASDASSVLSALESIDIVYSQSWQYDDAVAWLSERLGAAPARRRYSGIGGSVPL